MGTVLACSTVPYEAFPLERALAGVRGAGFASAVVGPSHAGSATLDLARGSAGASDLAEALSRAGLRAFALAPEIAPLDDESEQALRVILEQAKALGALQVWLSGPEAFDESGGLRPESEWDLDLREFAARAGRLASKARELGVELALPTQARLSGCASDLERLPPPADSLALAYSPGLVSYYSGINPRRDLEAVRSRVGALCLRDHRGARGEADFPPLGAGDIDYFGIRELLAKKGTLPPVVVEYLGGATPEELDRSAAAAYRFASMLFR